LSLARVKVEETKQELVRDCHRYLLFIVIFLAQLSFLGNKVGKNMQIVDGLAGELS
jgi:hypothetical protein